MGGGGCGQRGFGGYISPRSHRAAFRRATSEVGYSCDKATGTPTNICAYQSIRVPFENKLPIEAAYTTQAALATILCVTS